MELELIEVIREQMERCSIVASTENIVKGIGDDCAEIIPSSDENIIITTDSFMEGVHFRLSYFSPFSLGRRLASVNLSDIAAMGGRPICAFLNLEIPKRLESMGFWQDFLSGLCSRLQEFGASLLGGDTISSANGLLGVALTVVGGVDRGKAVYRSGAQPGDWIYCSGYLGEAGCGLAILERGIGHHLPLPVRRHLVRRHIDPIPRIFLGRLLADIGISSMIDISDGISTDLAHICRDSRVKGVINLRFLPVSRPTMLFSKATGIEPIDMALFSGEDFELCWTIEPSKARQMEKQVASILGRVPFRIGEIQEGRGLFAVHADGSLEDIAFKGYEH